MKTRKIFLRMMAVIGILLVHGISNAAIVLDFETDDGGAALVNGQDINTEFGTYVTIGWDDLGSDGSAGPAIFDSDPSGPNIGGPDPDLLVGLGNLLILQDDNSATQTTPGIFDMPNDESDHEDRGAIVFDFLRPVQLVSLDLVDINGGVNVDVTLTDDTGKTRVYHVQEKFTYDISGAGLPVWAQGWHILDLTTLTEQSGETGAFYGGTRVVPVPTEDLGFNPYSVVQLDVAFDGSGALDNVTFVPEPATMVLLGLGSILLRKTKK